MFVALLSVLLIASETAATATPPQAPATNEAAEAPESDKKICKRQPATGHLVGAKRVCMTAEQWKLTEEAGKRSRR